MKYKWLNKKQNQEVIVFFNGWGMDENIVKHLTSDKYDVIMFYDYNNLQTDFQFSTIKNSYKKCHLISWSMGVMIASKFDINYDSATAINGTIKPIDNSFGIPTRIYDLTIKGFNEKGATKFINSMFLENTNFPNIERDIESQKSELIAIKNYIGNESFQYTKVIISSDDKIIPTRNQVNYWEIEPNIKAGHCPLFLFKTWDEIL